MTTLPRIILAAIFFPVILTSAVPGNAATPSGDVLWSDVDESTLRASGDRVIVPASYRTVALDGGALDRILAAAPGEAPGERFDGSDTVISLPLPDGGSGRFHIIESPIMAPGLAAKFPGIRTFRGQGIDDPLATLRFDVTPAGFHAMILSPEGRVFIDPYTREDTGFYVSYLAGNARDGSAPPWSCGVRGEPSKNDPLVLPAEVSSGGTLRTYRLAVAATGEYTSFHGGTVAAGQAAIVTAMNRVNGIYERDVAIRMVLIANNNQLVFTNGGTDPYSNGNGGAMLGQNQSTIDSVIGNANYDIGHVFSTGGGGIASLSVPCRAGSKARGVTGQSSPVGDSFWVDFVAHEMGHQWGGTHTFNGTTNSCAGNRTGSTAYEPGSGTTIMAYAGICGVQNIQPNSDDHFHGASFDQIVAYSTGGAGNGCAAQSSTGNGPPVAEAGAAFVIPINTPFELCGSATDPQGDPLTYGWEEFDLGPAGAPNSPSGNAAIFRSFSPVPSPCRTFPRQEDLLANTQTLGELLPSFGRTMTFRLTVRDNRSGGGGVGNDTTTVQASASAGPFLVTSPNTSVTWNTAVSQTVTWNVAGTTGSPVNCSSVDILLSTDGGDTFPLNLAAGTPNDGSQAVTLPSVSTTAARVKVLCSDNIFFDLSNSDFTITDDGPPPPPPPVGSCLFSSDFAAGADGFAFVDDAFRGTSAPAYASGSSAGGDLDVTLGGIDGADILGMSGGWRKNCDLDSATDVTLTFDMTLTQTSEYESDEFSEALVTVDGVESIVLSRITGNGNGGTSQTVSGTVTLPLSLAAGGHEITLGCYNNKKTFDNESTTCAIDNVSVAEGATGCTVLHAADFESGTGGWGDGAGESTCSTGAFVVGTPDGVNNGGVQTQVSGAATGTGAFFTQPNTVSAGQDDVDGGTCVARSPVIDAGAFSSVEVSFAWFHGQRDAGDDPGGDFFEVELSTDGGSTFSSLVSNGDATSNATWTGFSTTAGGGQLQLRIRAADGSAFGDLVEAGLDDVIVCGQN